MKATFNRETAEKIEEWCNYQNGTDILYRTEEGDFFLEREVEWLDGRRLVGYETAEQLAPELSSSSPGSLARRDKRVQFTREVIAMTSQEAMKWCIVTFIPETFRGYLLDCI